MRKTDLKRKKVIKYDFQFQFPNFPLGVSMGVSGMCAQGIPELGLAQTLLDFKRRKKTI